MALASLKTWAKEKLTFSDLNAEFSHIRNNALSLISPLTGALDFDGKELILDGDADTSITADTDDQIDFRVGGSDVMVLTSTSLTLTGHIDLQQQSPEIASIGSLAWALDSDNNATSRLFEWYNNRSPGGSPNAGTQIMQLTEAGMLSLNETANANMTIGGTWNQLGNDDEIQAYKSSDVGHSFTALVEADTYARFQKVVGADGGLLIEGFTETTSSARAFILSGSILDGAVNDVTSTSAVAVVEVVAYVDDDSTGRESFNAASVAGNLFAVRDAGLTQFIVKEDGEIASNLAATVYDEYDDVDLVRAFTQVTVPRDVIKDKWDHFVRSNEQTLVDIGILGAPLDQHPLYSVTKLQMLHNGAIWQLYTRHMELLERYDALEHKVLLLEGHA